METLFSPFTDNREANEGLLGTKSCEKNLARSGYPGGNTAMKATPQALPA
jgi:hypothetical protein